MINRLNAMKKARKYLRFNDPYARPKEPRAMIHEQGVELDEYWNEVRTNPLFSRKLDAIVVSTSPSQKMDFQRADCAVQAVKDLYRNISHYDGLWIAAGQLNKGVDGIRQYEGSQRKGIVDRLVSQGVPQDRITQIDGSDTVDKVRRLLEIPEVKRGGVKYMGVSSYPLHIARFNLALNHAKRENLAPQNLEVVGIPNPYDSILFDFEKIRLGDWVYGWSGLLKEAVRLEESGFSGSIPGQGSAFHKKLRALNSSDRDIDRQGKN